MKHYPIMTKKQMRGLYLRATADLACWTGATMTLLSYDYPTIAAAVGATGIVYLVNVVKTIRGIQKATAAFEREMEETDKYMKNVQIVPINSEEELEALFKHLEGFNDAATNATQEQDKAEDQIPNGKTFLEILEEQEQERKK